jgi:hypothetical protein
MGEKPGTEPVAVETRLVSWTCPICGRAEDRVTTAGSGGSDAVSYLLQHVRRSDDDHHGPRDRAPDVPALESPEDWIDEAAYEAE